MSIVNNFELPNDMWVGIGLNAERKELKILHFFKGNDRQEGLKVTKERSLDFGDDYECTVLKLFGDPQKFKDDLGFFVFSCGVLLGETNAASNHIIRAIMDALGVDLKDDESEVEKN